MLVESEKAVFEKGIEAIGNMLRSHIHMPEVKISRVVKMVSPDNIQDAMLKLTDDATGVFFATNAYGDNSAPLFEIVFEKGVARYMDKQLWIDGQIRAEDVQASVGKSKLP